MPRFSNGQMGATMEFEYSVFQSSGGSAGTYVLQNPWNDPNVQILLVSASFSAAGGLAISPQDATNPPAITAATVFNNDGGGYPGLVLLAPAASLIALPAVFTPVPVGRLKMTVSGAGNVLLSYVWRKPFVQSITGHQMAMAPSADDFWSNNMAETVAATSLGVQRTS